MGGSPHPGMPLCSHPSSLICGDGVEGTGLGQAQDSPPSPSHKPLQALKRGWQTFLKRCAKLLQSCLTLYDPMDCSLPGSSIHGPDSKYLDIANWTVSGKGNGSSILAWEIP